MATEAIVERILLDADREAEAILAEAKRKAEETITNTKRKAEAEKAAVVKETEARAKAIREGKEAAARLDSAKLLLGEKRRVIDAVYSRALEALLSLSEKESVALADSLLKQYAEEGDEIVFAENYPYAKAVSALPVCKEKNLKFCKKREAFSGGFKLSGAKSDTDISYGAILIEDREAHQAELYKRLFN